ncbi:hypothetical protein Pelo_12620 [Pelomyxa schiedti]|nr:hypothetical protein Pelo_12620 [Pelomyxa schiedti]
MAATCGKCNLPIAPTSKFVEAVGKKWHHECFLCSKCNVLIGAAQFVLFNNTVLCPPCGNDALKRDPNQKCHSCAQPIGESDNVAQMAGLAWHWQCYNCSKCGVSLVTTDDMYLNRERRLLCSGCYRRPCARCGEHIENEFLTLHDERVHLTCFTCAKCMSILDPAKFFEVDMKQYCPACHAARKAEATRAAEGIAKCPRCGNEAVCKWMLQGKRVCQECKNAGATGKPAATTTATTEDPFSSF